MKKCIILLLFLTSVISYSQTKYYTTDGKNRMTETELKEELLKRERILVKHFGKKEGYTSWRIKWTEIKKDSIIHEVTLEVSNKKRGELITLAPLSKYKKEDFPKFNLSVLTDRKFNLEQLKGKPSMISFWFTKCGTCVDEIIDELPILNKIKIKYKDDFNFVAIIYEKKEDVENFIKKHPFDFEHIIKEKDLTDKLMVKEYPVNLFLDKQGVLKYVKEAKIPDHPKKEDEVSKIGEENEIIEIIEKLK